MGVATFDGVRVSYGEWEPDPDASPVYTSRPAWPGSVILKTTRDAISGWRRRRMETWYEGDQLMGRWEWERRAK